MIFDELAWKQFKTSVNMLANSCLVNVLEIKKYHIFLIGYHPIFYRNTIQYAFLMEYFKIDKDMLLFKIYKYEIIQEYT